HASHGRLELSYGASWFAKEHHELGLEFLDTPQRIDAFEEAVQSVKGLLTTDGCTFEGRYFQARNATRNPKPGQQPLPLWIGASGGTRMMPIAARYAGVWHCGGGPQELIRRARLLDELCATAGRDPATRRRASSLPLEGSHDELPARIEALEEAGFSSLMCGW